MTGAFKASVERWRPAVLAEWARAGYRWSPSQYLSVIQQESGGNPAAHHPKSEAHGLGQVIPGTLAGYRTATGDAAADYETNPETQIRVGAWVYNRGIKRALREYAGSDPDYRWHLADIVYSVGGGTLNRILSSTKAQLGRTPTSIDELEAALPIPLPGNRPYHHARVVTARSRQDDPALSMTGWIGETPGPMPGAAWLPVVLMIIGGAALWFALGR